MFKVQTYNKIAKIGLNQFPNELYEVSPDIQLPDAIILRSHSMHEMQIPTTVKVIGRAGAGVNNIPVETLTKLGVPVFNTPGANANAVSELAIAGMLLASRNICQAWNFVRELKVGDDELHAVVEQSKKQFKGYELMGKTLGIVGLGSIGVKVANAAIHLGMNVVGYDPTISVSHAWELSAEATQAHSIEDLLAQSDFISLHVPLMDATKHMINEARIQKMKSNAVLLNFSRDGIVDNQAMLQALNEEKISTYVCDFPCATLRNHESVISLPHLGASTKEAEENCAVRLAKQVRNYLEYGAIGHSANFPMVEAAKNYEGVRLSIVNANIPNMVTQISSKLADAGLNIVGLLNKSRDEIAYTLLDVQGEISRGILDEIAKIEGVLQLRKLVQNS